MQVQERLFGHLNFQDLELEADAPSRSAHQVRLVQWYPGHIARAEKLLKEQLRGVDAVVEVRALHW